MPSRVKNQVRRSATSRRGCPAGAGAGGGAAAAVGVAVRGSEIAAIKCSQPARETRVEHVAEPVAEQGNSQDRQRQPDAGEQHAVKGEIKRYGAPGPDGSRTRA